MAKKKAASDDYLRISAAAQSAGVSRQTVEYYIMIGLLTPIRLGGQGGRFFDQALVRRIRLIRRLNRTGYTLREIGRTYLRSRDKG
jgi:DNA-binding transcriptional MerR regulator